MKNKFDFDEVVKINPKSGALNNSDISTLVCLKNLNLKTEQDLIGKTDVISSMIES